MDDFNLKKLITDYGPLVTSVCKKMINDYDLAKDAAQEVWIEIIKSLPSFKGNSKLSTWVYKVTYYTVLKFSKKEKDYSFRFMNKYFDEQIPDTDSPVEIDVESWVKENCEKCLTGIIHCLDSKNRLAYILREIIKLPYEEIAEIFSKKETTIRKIVSRSRKKIDNFLNKRCILINPDGSCNCRMKDLLTKTNLPHEINKLSIDINNIYNACEDKKNQNFWKNLI